MNNLLQDIRFAFRMLMKKPAFAVIAIATLALGIGANTAIFTAINAVLFKPLPIADEARVVVLQQFRRDKQDPNYGVSYLNFSDWRERSQSFSGMAIVQSDETTLLIEEEPLRAVYAIVSADFFTTLGIKPFLGGGFVATDDQPKGPDGMNAVMLTYTTWQNRFGSDPKIIGKQLSNGEDRFQIVGVTPPGLFPLQKEPIDFWATVGINGATNDKESANASRGYSAYPAAIARLKPDVTIAQAQAELSNLNEALTQAHPNANGNTAVRVVALRELFVKDARPVLWLLLGVVGAVLLIACVNVANILLTRAAARQRELSIRAALGASKWDIVQQLLVESLMLALAGGVIGLLVSLWMVDGIVALLPNDIPRLSGLLPDWRVLLFTMSAVLLTGLLCGLLPAFSVSRQNLADAIKDGGRSATGGLARGRLRNALVVAEIAIALTLLVGAGLLFKSLYRLNQVNPGFNTENILTAQFGLGSNRYVDRTYSPARINQFLSQLQERVERLPGVKAVTNAQCVPFSGNENNTQFEIVERPAPANAKPAAQLRFVSPGYFDALQIPLQAGRALTPQDNPSTPNVMLVNKAFVREHLSGESPLGKRMKLGWGGDAPKEIVGVVGDVRHRGLGDDVRPEMYVPQAQFANAGITLIVRTQGDPLNLVNQLKQEIRALDPALPVTDIKTLAQFRQETLAVPRFNSFLLGGFALLALLLTLVGLYGVMSYSVTQRTPEIGIRMALGASATDVLRMIVAQGARLVAFGLALGLVGAFALTRVLQNLLYDVRTTDPLTFALMALLLASVALLACYWPARRATQVDPLIALRRE